jgi:alpha-D-ribose 1-methylphosphonate 5-triphosphate synthase subunit PhnL
MASLVSRLPRAWRIDGMMPEVSKPAQSHQQRAQSGRQLNQRLNCGNRLWQLEGCKVAKSSGWGGSGAW